MGKTRDDYPDELNKYYQRMVRAYDAVLGDFQDDTRSKSSEHMLDAVYDFFISVITCENGYRRIVR